MPAVDIGFVIALKPLVGTQEERHQSQMFFVGDLA